MNTSTLTTRIRAANEQGRKALIPFLPGGFPDRDRFWDELAALDANGADVIEIGAPFSDPVADGPTVEQASLDCLRDGVCLSWILGELSKRRASLSAEIALMGYLNPFLQFGLERFARDASEAGVSGLIIPDVPLEESDDIKAALNAHGLDLIYLIGLNTTPERMRQYAERARGFVYFVSVLGTTGERETLPREITDKLRQAREIFDIPMAIGFGIKTPEQLAAFGDLVDAAVFGSSLITHLRNGGHSAEFMRRWRCGGNCE